MVLNGNSKIKIPSHFIKIPYIYIHKYLNYKLWQTINN
jgi:hypothetical protein